MKLIFSSAQKSIKGFGQFTLPDMTVLTGPNGSGKTHFLEAIASRKKIYVYDIHSNEILANIKYVNNQRFFYSHLKHIPQHKYNMYRFSEKEFGIVTTLT
ncbi:MAG: AAA family ATPase [Gammaproteobacteria bacterium]|nr:AAA family ATPase [Gammaproteobacteria bacterium]